MKVYDFDADLKSVMREETSRNINVDISWFIVQYLYEGIWE